MKNYPTTINGFNCYQNGKRLVGVTDEVVLPDMNAMTTSITGAGIGGTIEVPIVGFFDNMEQQITFRTLADDMFSLMTPDKLVDFTLRGSVQITNIQTGAIGYKGMRVAVRGYLKSFSPGNVKVADAMNSSVTLSLVYLLIEVDGDVKLEVDKLNFKFVVDGVDVTEKIRRLT